MIWGGLFLFILLLLITVTLVQALILGRRLKGLGDFAFFPDLPEILPANGEVPLSWALPRGLVLLPGLRLFLGRRGFSQGVRKRLPRAFRRIQWLIPVAPGQGDRLVAEEIRGERVMKTPPRGLAREGGTLFRVTDILGFFSWDLFSADRGARRPGLAFAPLPRNLPSKEGVFLTGGSRHQPRGKPRRRDDLLEVRPYFPGDDPRRIHWKMLSHTGDLFLRVGEETPPPRDRWVLLLDPGCGALKGGEALLLQDALAETAAALLKEAREQDVEMSLVLPGRGAVSSEQQERVLAGLGFEDQPDAPREWGEEARPASAGVMAVTSPFSGHRPVSLKPGTRVFLVNPWQERPLRRGRPRHPDGRAEGLFFRRTVDLLEELVWRPAFLWQGPLAEERRRRRVSLRRQREDAGREGLHYWRKRGGLCVLVS